jgi:hypothetical protein
MPAARSSSLFRASRAAYETARVATYDEREAVLPYVSGGVNAVSGRLMLICSGGTPSSSAAI